jgi:CRP-like cAMP-binding protein/metal-dependent hydrolase (beta-lactamase superfamily II)
MAKSNPVVPASDHVTALPRGGFLVETSEGQIQFGSPPETIKDTMEMPGGTPQVFVLPFDHFDPSDGISMAEIEFPTYYNFFLKKRKVVVYVHPDHVDNLKTVFQEAFLGPERVDVASEVEKIEGYHVPNIKGEMEYFRGGLSVEDVVDIREISAGGVHIGNVNIYQTESKGFRVVDNGKTIAEIPGRMKSQAKYDLGKTLTEPFIPPEFGITCLGPSHGFDCTQNTSGFIIWLNMMGIMVDPPVNITSWLRDSNVNPKLIDTVILTHCHADHDAGTFQKILEETKIAVYTTPTVMKSFLTKYSTLTRIPASTLMNMFDFRPVKMNVQYNIHGGLFNFYYSVHSIPTMGFYFLYRDKTFLYSSDHMADPKVLGQLHEEGTISRKRLKFLTTLPWDMDIIYHEAGIPPLHTPIAYLNSLPEAVQKKITVYHIAEKDFPKETSLTLAKFGIGNTVYPDFERHEFEDAFHILDVFSRIDLFTDLPFKKSKYLLLNVKKEQFSRGDFIIRKDTPGDKFYVVVSGNVTISGVQDVTDKIYGTYEYFGEASLVLGTLRGADVIAATSVTSYSLDKQHFLRLIQDTVIEDSIRRIAKMRNGESWTVIRSNRYFQRLSSAQITGLELILTPVRARAGQLIARPGKTVQYLYLLIGGKVSRRIGSQKPIEMRRGDIIGDVLNLREGNPCLHEYRAEADSRLYRMLASDFLHFLDENPGIYMEMLFDGR